MQSDGGWRPDRRCGATDSMLKALVASLPSQHPRLQSLSLGGHTDLGGATIKALLSAGTRLWGLDLRETGAAPAKGC